MELGLRWIASSIRAFVQSGDITRRDLRRLVFPAYIASGILVTGASLFNPIGPSLILTAGVGASFGLNFGLLFIPGMVGNHTLDRATATRSVPLGPSHSWTCLRIHPETRSIYPGAALGQSQAPPDTRGTRRKM